MAECCFEKNSTACKILIKKKCLNCHFKLSRGQYEIKINDIERYMEENELKRVTDDGKVIFVPENSNIGTPFRWSRI